MIGTGVGAYLAPVRHGESGMPRFNTVSRSANGRAIKRSVPCANQELVQQSVWLYVIHLQPVLEEVSDAEGYQFRLRQTDEQLSKPTHTCKNKELR